MRNNITTEEYPDGVFHAHPEYHNIKKEGIGLIEAMGLYILPARLKRQTEEIAAVLIGQTPFDYDALTESDDLFVHRDMIKKLIEENPVVSDAETADRIIKNHINRVCVNILENTAVFKKDEKGVIAFKKFLNELGMK